MPHFISLIVICGLIHIFTQSGGILTQLVNWITGTEHSSLLGYADVPADLYFFRHLAEYWLGQHYIPVRHEFH